jgi:glycosyltransferase involved in cell wall biosynthesis
MAEPKPIVSVCLLSWNQDAFLAGAIESALSQECGPVEIVVADDASSDESPDIISRYMKRQPNRIRAILGKK